MGEILKNVEDYTVNYWSWSGKYIGHRSGDYLYSKNGKPIGKFYGNELYDFSGQYIGEIRDQDRLIVNHSLKYKRKSSICTPCDSFGSSYCDYVGYVMIAGYEDFKYNT